MDGQSNETMVDEHPNLAVVARAGAAILAGMTGSAASDDGVFADEFVLHYFNAQLPELTGDYQGVDGLREFFGRLHKMSSGSFRTAPRSLTPFGDELVAAFVTHTATFGGTEIEVDAMLLWRVFGGQVREAWDIPAVNTTRLPTASGVARAT